MENLKNFLEELKQVVKEGREVQKALSFLLKSGGETLEDKAEHLNKRLEATLTVSQKTLDAKGLGEEEARSLVYIYPPYEIDKSYKKDDIVEHLGKLYKAKKKHTGDYQTLPNLDKEHWQEINLDGTAVKEVKPVEAYYSDITYHKGDRVAYYGKTYEYINEKAEAGKDPEKDTDFWKVIEV